MNQQERDSLREKHRVGQNEADNQCQSCYSPDGYPCDTIKVLDAWEADVHDGSEVSTTREVCNHADVESLTDYYKQHYYEGEYSVGDLCVMLARAEVGIEAMAETLAMAEMDTTEYPPEGQNEECDHIDENGLCWCERGFKRCPECHEWFGIDHARKDMTATNVVTESASVSATWLGSCPHQADSRLLPGLDLTTEIATSVTADIAYFMPPNVMAV